MSKLENRRIQYRMCIELISEPLGGDTKKIKAWMSEPNYGLGGLIPTDMIMLGKGDKLLAFIHSQLEGVLK